MLKCNKITGKPWVFHKSVKNSCLFRLFKVQMCKIYSKFNKLKQKQFFKMQMHLQKLEMHLQKLEMHLQNSWKCICKSWKCICINWKSICKIHGNAFAKSMKMHLQKPQFFYGFPKAINAFPKSKIGNAFFFPGFFPRKINQIRLN